MAASSTTKTAASIECEFPFPSQPSESGMTDLVVEICNHPLDRLVSEIGVLVEHFSPDARGRIKESMELDLMNKAKLSSLEAQLRARGDVRNANAIVSKVQQASNETMIEIFPMRRHLKDIAANLNELMEPGTLESAEVTQIIISEIEESAKSAFESAENGCQMYAAVTNTLKQTSLAYAVQAAQYTQKALECQTSADEHSELADNHSDHAKLSGIVSSGSAVSTICSAASATFVTNPLGLAVGTGLMVIFGAVTAWQYVQRQRQHHMSDEAKAKAFQLKQESLAADKLAKDAEESSKVSESIVEVAEINMSMWSGIRIAAREASASFERLGKMNPHGARRAAFDRRMKEFGEQLILFVSAIDEYLYHMSKTSYFPPNLSLRRVIGVKAYDAMEEAMRSNDSLAALPHA